MERVNVNLRMNFYNNVVNEWVGFCLEMIGIVVLVLLVLFMVIVGWKIIDFGKMFWISILMIYLFMCLRDCV